jgi:chemotaxis protein MotB
MKKVLSCFLAATLFTGCGVSKKVYKATLDESEARRIQLEKTGQELDQTKQALETSKKEMEDLKAATERETSSLKGQLEELSRRGIVTSKEIEALRQEREGLSASNKAKDTEISMLKQDMGDQEKAKAYEIAALKQQMENLAKEREYLNRELERLQVKAGEISSEKERELASVKSTYENLLKELQKEVEKGDIKITQAVDRLSVNLVEKILFDSGKAEIKPEGLKVLKRVGDILKNISDRQIRVEGHTDNVKIGAGLRERFPTNWELSTARATNVVRYLQDKIGIDPKMLTAAGFSEYRPVANNDTPENRAQNRRIEIVLLPLDVDRVLEELKK